MIKFPRFSRIGVKEIPFTQENLDRFRSQDNMLSHARCNNVTEGVMLVKNNSILVGYVVWEGDFIIALEVTKDFRAKGFGGYLLNRAYEEGANKLSVNKKNKAAIQVYLSQGWITYDETPYMLFMKKNKKNGF